MMIIMITPRTTILKLKLFVDLDVAGNLKQAAEERIYIKISIIRVADTGTVQPRHWQMPRDWRHLSAELHRHQGR
jgi:hypothetical protein